MATQRSQDAARAAVTCLSALSPLGDDAAQTAAAIRAGLSALSEHPYFDLLTPDPEWDEPERLTGALVPGLEPVAGRARLLALALPALRALVESARLLRRELASTALCLALPAPDAVTVGWALGRDFAEELALRAGLPPLPVVRVAEAGHAAGLRMLGEAGALVGAGDVERAIVLAVDSYHDEARLALFDAGYWLRSLRAPDGFLPGEAAIALLVEPARRSARPPRCTFGAPSFAEEARVVAGDKASSGRALAEVVAAQLAAPGAPAALGWAIADHNGESYRSAEWGLVATRLAEQLAPGFALAHPAECVGDVGAASASLALLCASEAFARGHAPADSALLLGAADAGERAALFVHAPA